MTGLTELSGTVSVAYTTSIVNTLRRARREMEMLYERPTACLLNPIDAETIDLLCADGPSTGAFLAGGPSPFEDNVFGGLSRVLSPRVTAGTAWLGTGRRRSS